MRFRTIIIFFTTICIKLQSQPIYLDQDDNPITEAQFVNIFNSQPGILAVKNDSLDIFKTVVRRQEKGTIDNFAEIFYHLKADHSNLEVNKPIVIIYYPGKDPCNTSGSATKKTRKKWFGELENKLQKIAGIKPIYLYRVKDGTEKYDGILDYQKDKGNFIARQFFKFHYPCSSYVVIAPNGNYISYFGEFGKEGVWKSLQELVDK